MRSSFQWGLITLSAVSLLLPIANAGTLAYWRHEEGPAGFDVPPSPNAIIDSSGNDNYMRTFNEFTGATYTTNVSPVPLRSGLPNNLALDFDWDEDGAGPDLNDDNYTDLQLIDIALFDELTAELAFNLESNFAFQALTGKDGNPVPTTPVQPFVIKVRGDGFPGGIPNQLQVEWLDGDGDQHNLASGFSIIPGTWYHVAFVLTDTTAQLWIAAGSSAYTLADEITNEDFAGASGEVLYPDVTPFTVGRGQFAGNITDWADAIIDEVRYGDSALSPSEFLFNPSLVGDGDGDGVPDGTDVCPDTPSGAAVDAEGRPIGDLNQNCRTDMADFALFQQGFTGP